MKKWQNNNSKFCLPCENNSKIIKTSIHIQVLMIFFNTKDEQRIDLILPLFVFLTILF